MRPECLFIEVFAECFFKLHIISPIQSIMIMFDTIINMSKLFSIGVRSYKMGRYHKNSAIYFRK